MFSQLENEPDQFYRIPNNFMFKDFLLEMVFIRSSLTAIKSFYVSIHKRQELVKNVDKTTFAKLSINGNTEYALIYEKIKIYSLPEPYETNCFDFKQMNYSSSKECIGDCRLRLLIDKYPDKWMGNYLTFEPKDLKIFDHISVFRSNTQLDQNISEKCKTFCGAQSECYSEYYRMDLKPYARNYGQPYICIYASDIPDLVYTYLPKMYFIEFVLFVASSVSLWFGFSVLMLSDVILKLFFVIQNKFNTRIKISSNVMLFLKVDNDRARLARNSKYRINKISEGIHSSSVLSVIE